MNFSAPKSLGSKSLSPKSVGPVRWLLIGMSVLLFALAVSRGFDAFATLPIKRAASLVARGDAPSLATLNKTIARYGDAEAALLATATLYNLMSGLAPEAERAETRLRAEDSLSRGLKFRPVTGAGWLTLARMMHIRGAPKDVTASALELSYLMSPVAPERALDRLSLAADLSAFLSPEGQNSVQREARLALRHPKTAEGFAVLVAKFPSITRWVE